MLFDPIKMCIISDIILTEKSANGALNMALFYADTTVAY